MISFERYEKIGILGGTFNPVHMGHLLMAEYAKEALGLDVVILMPSGKSYMKADTNVLSGEERLKMLQLCIEDNPNLITSDMEICRSGNTYTYETLLQMKKLCPSSEIYFILGADSLYNMERWVKPEIIFANCTILAAGRNNASKQDLLLKKQDLEKRFEAKIILMDFPEIDISSTVIRENVRNNKSIRYMVHDNVWKYICENQLYKAEE